MENSRKIWYDYTKNIYSLKSPFYPNTQNPSFFTTLLFGCSPPGAPFWDIFSISVALSLGVVLQLSNITPGGSEGRVEGRNTRWKRDNKKTLKTILSPVFSLDHKDFLSKLKNLKN